MDFQNRAGGKTGTGGVASASESNRDRRERLRQLALETIDLNKVCVNTVIVFVCDGWVISHSELSLSAESVTDWTWCVQRMIIDIVCKFCI